LTAHFRTSTLRHSAIQHHRTTRHRLTFLGRPSSTSARLHALDVGLVIFYSAPVGISQSPLLAAASPTMPLSSSPFLRLHRPRSNLVASSPSLSPIESSLHGHRLRVNAGGLEGTRVNQIGLAVPAPALAAIPSIDNEAVQQRLDRVRTYYELLNLPFEALLAFISEHEYLFTSSEYSSLLRAKVPGREIPPDAEERVSEIFSR
ncbi:hypothetical protein Taro_019270, partial [Colocasia esculenta]|nr:hypothetical protein [Colocasia esculenta]